MWRIVIYRLLARRKPGISSHPDEASAIQKTLVEKGVVTVAEADSIYELVAANETPAVLSSLKSLNIPQASSLIEVVDNFDTFHFFGTDELGRDVFIRLVYGTRVSMGVGILVAIASALVGLLIGSIAGFYGGIVDTILMRVTDALISLPTIPVLIVMAAIDLSKIPWLKAIISTSNESVFKMIIILCLFSWMTVARLVRGSILSIREREFVLAARTLGARDSTIIVRHMFPNVMAPMLVSITLGVGESILFEAALSFLGLGIQPPMPSWGNMLTNAQELIYQAPFLAILPGILILLTTISFNYLGDGLQDAVDPKALRR
jgi:peptide/nickel transport system permease protein